jgi:hypothetical protein
MKASYLLGAAVSALFATAPAMADSDFRAVEKLSNATAMTESKLSAVEGGADAVDPTIIAVNASQNWSKQILIQKASIKQSNFNKGDVTVVGGGDESTTTGYISQSNTAYIDQYATQTANQGNITIVP